MKVTQFRYIRGSYHNGWNLIKSDMRKADAIGMAKSLLVSHLDMLADHEHFPERNRTDIVMAKSVPEYSCSMYDDNDDLIYKIEYKVEEDATEV